MVGADLPGGLGDRDGRRVGFSGRDLAATGNMRPCGRGRRSVQVVLAGAPGRSVRLGELEEPGDSFGRALQLRLRVLEPEQLSRVVD
jgi:hypothetical protein